MADVEAELEGLKTRLLQEIGRYLSLENRHGMWAEWYEANGYSEEKIKAAKDQTARARSVRVGLEKVLHGADE
jgi:hypothetical protein